MGTTDPATSETNTGASTGASTGINDVVTAKPCTTITDVVATIGRSITTIQSNTDNSEKWKRDRCLEMCRNINSVTPTLTTYFNEINDLPDAFVLFSFYDKLRTLELLAQSAIIGFVDSSIADAGLGDNIEVDQARKNIKLFFQNFEAILKRIREIAPTLSTVRVPQSGIPQPACGHSS